MSNFTMGAAMNILRYAVYVSLSEWPISVRKFHLSNDTLT